MPSPSPSSYRRVRHRRGAARRLLGWFLTPAGEPPRRRVRWGRLGAAAAGLIAAGYLTLATGAFGFVHFHRGMDTVRWVDLALPWRWDRYRLARGDHHVATAQRLAAANQPREALLFARAGVAQSPANRAGRLLLADLLLAAGRPEYARETLLAGVGHHRHDAAYWQRVLTLLLGAQEDQAVLTLARTHLPDLPAGAEPARVLALAAATAAYFRGQYDQAEDFLRRPPGLPESRDGRLLLARIEHDRGFRDLGLLLLRRLAADLPRDAEVHRELAARLRARGLTDEARRTSLALQIAAPALAVSRLELLDAYQAEGDQDRVRQEAGSMLRDFGDDRAALLGLADWAANHGAVELVDRLREHFTARGFPAEPMAPLAVEAAIVARDYRGALEAIRRLAPPTDAVRARSALLDSLQALAHLGLGDRANARLYLNHFLDHSHLRTEHLLVVANRLANLDGSAFAWQVLQRATERDPRNQAALARLIELDLSLNRIDALPGHVQRYLGMRRPSPDILRVVQQRLGSDLFLFSNEAPVALEAVRRSLAATSPRP